MGSLTHCVWGTLVCVMLITQLESAVAHQHDYLSSQSIPFVVRSFQFLPCSGGVRSRLACFGSSLEYFPDLCGVLFWVATGSLVLELFPRITTIVFGIQLFFSRWSSLPGPRRTIPIYSNT